MHYLNIESNIHVFGFQKLNSKIFIHVPNPYILCIGYLREKLNKLWTSFASRKFEINASE